MCCEGPEARTTWAPSLVAAGSLHTILPVHLPWVVDSVGPLTQAGRPAGSGKQSQAWPGLLGQAPVWTCSCPRVSTVAHGDGLTHFL